MIPKTLVALGLVAVLVAGCGSEDKERRAQAPKQQRGQRTGELDVAETSLPARVGVATSLVPPTLEIPGADVYTEGGEIVIVLSEHLLGFQPNSAVLGPEASALLAPIAEEAIKAQGGIRVESVGHASSEGDPIQNDVLSRDRGAAVADHLVEDLLVPDDLVKSDGVGSSCPRESNATSQGRQANRRVEVRLVPADSPIMDPAQCLRAS